MKARHFTATVTFLIGNKTEQKLFTAVNFNGTVDEYREILRKQFPDMGNLADLKEVGSGDFDEPKSAEDLAAIGLQAKQAAEASHG